MPSPATTANTRSSAKSSSCGTCTLINLWTPELVQQGFEGKGVGRKTLSEICTENGLDQADIIRKLSTRNIAMSPGDTLKKTADASNELPIELLKIILI